MTLTHRVFCFVMYFNKLVKIKEDNLVQFNGLNLTPCKADLFRPRKNNTLNNNKKRG